MPPANFKFAGGMFYIASTAWATCDNGRPDGKSRHGGVIMGSKKRSARAREVADFKSQLENGLGGLDDLFANEERREQKREADHDAAMRWKSCEKKNRYATRDEAEEARKWCEDRGTRGLEIYRCEYCGGWHLTSHPFE